MSTRNTPRNTPRKTLRNTPNNTNNINNSTNIYSIEPIECSHKFYQRLTEVFAEQDITPSSRMEEIMFQAGQQAVLKYIQKTVRSFTVSSDKQDTIKPKSFIKRLLRSE